MSWFKRFFPDKISWRKGYYDDNYYMLLNGKEVCSFCELNLFINSDYEVFRCYSCKTRVHPYCLLFFSTQDFSRICARCKESQL